MNIKQIDYSTELARVIVMGYVSEGENHWQLGRIVQQDI